MKVVNDQKSKKKKKKKSGRHTLILKEKLRMKKMVLGGRIMVSGNLKKVKKNL